MSATGGDAVLEHYAALASDALDSLGPEPEVQHRLYRMLKLKVMVVRTGRHGPRCA